MRPFRLSPWQVLVLTYTTSFCVTPFDFEPLHRELGRFIWLACLGQLLVVAAGTWLASRLLRESAGETWQALVSRRLSPWAGQMAAALLGLYLFLWGPVGNLVTLTRLEHAFMMPATPSVVLVAVALVLSGYAAYLGIPAIARSLEAAAFLVLPATAVLSLLPYFTGVDFGHLWPLTRGRLTLSGEVADFALGLRGFVPLLALLALAPRRGRATIPLWVGSLASWAFVTLLVLLPHVFFQQEAMQSLPFPALSALDTVKASPLGIESLLPLTFLVWYVLSFAVVSLSLYATAHLWASLLHRAEKRVVLWLIPPAALIASLPLSLHQERALMDAWSLLGYAVAVLLPGLLVLKGAAGRRAAA